MVRKVEDAALLQNKGFKENEEKKVRKNGRMFRVFEKKNFGGCQRTGAFFVALLSVITLGLPAFSQTVSDQWSVLIKNKITRKIPEASDALQPVQSNSKPINPGHGASHTAVLLRNSEPEGPYFGKASMVESFRGAFNLLRNKVTEGCRRYEGNFLLNLLTADQPTVVCLAFKHTQNKREIILKDDISLKGKDILLPVTELNGSEQENAKTVTAILTELKKVYNNENEPPKKIFLPLALFEGAGHAVTIVIESNKDNPGAPNITIVNPFGKDSYQKSTNNVAKGIYQVYPQATYVFNKVKQQEDARTCGFHQVENILLLLPQDNVQEFVGAGKLPKRSTIAIQARVDSYKQKIGSAYQQMSTWFDTNWNADAIKFDENGKMFAQQRFANRYLHHFT